MVMIVWKDIAMMKNALFGWSSTKLKAKSYKHNGIMWLQIVPISHISVN